MATDVDIVNRALEEIASQSQIASLSGTSPEQIAASTLYQGVVDLCLRDVSPEFARRVATLAVPFGVQPTTPWTYVYTYPSDCVRVLQVMPSSPSASDPQPVRWSVQDTPTDVKAIMSNEASAKIVYITNDVTVTMWDATFAEAVVRLLASEIVMSIGGRPDFSRQKLQEAGQLMSSDMGRDS